MSSKWIPILTPPSQGESPYDWNSPYVGQCVWGAYYRVLKNGWSAPCYYDRPSKTAGYTNAKEWLKEFREPWVPFYLSEHPDYIPVPGDVIVWNGTYGHVALIEQTIIPGQKYVISDWNRVAPRTYGTAEWNINSAIGNTGPVLGYLHYEPQNEKHVTPVERNSNVTQIQATDGTLRVRLAPNLSGEYYCSITPGYYNVLSSVAATNEDKAKIEGLSTWYEIESGKWCANITTKYLPAGTEDPTRGLEELFADIMAEFKAKDEENRMLKETISRAVDILTEGLK